MRNTTHMQLLQGEAKMFGATRTKSICGCYQVEVREGATQLLWAPGR